MAAISGMTAQQLIEKMRGKIRKKYDDALRLVALNLAAIAYQTWRSQGKNMTGNTAAGIGAALYYKGACISKYHPSTIKPLHKYLWPGDELWSGQTVQEYSKQQGEFRKHAEIHASTGDADFEAFIKSYKPTTQNYCIVVVSASPYSSYLQGFRHLDLLTSTVMRVQNTLDFCVNEYALK